MDGLILIEEITMQKQYLKKFLKLAQNMQSRRRIVKHED